MKQRHVLLFWGQLSFIPAPKEKLMTQLMQKMEVDLRLRNLSSGTQSAYLCHVKRFARFFERSPEHIGQLGTDDVRAFLLHLEKCGLAPATRIVYHASLNFLYTHTLGRPEVMDTIPRPRQGPDKDVLPLLKEEVAALLNAATSRPFDYTFLALLLDTGLRISEACHLRTEDIDSSNGLLHVRCGKGKKPRAVKLGDKLLRLLRRYWVVEKPPGPWLFPSQNWVSPGVRHPERWNNRHVAPKTIRQRLHKITNRAGIQRKVTPHDFRRTHATWLLEAGAELHTVQVVLGHANPKTTTRYTRVRPELIRRVPSPLEMM